MGNQRVAVLEALHDQVMAKVTASTEKSMKELKLEMKGEMEELAGKLRELRGETKIWIKTIFVTAWGVVCHT